MQMNRRSFLVGMAGILAAGSMPAIILPGRKVLPMTGISYTYGGSCTGRMTSKIPNFQELLRCKRFYPAELYDSFVLGR